MGEITIEELHKDLMASRETAIAEGLLRENYPREVVSKVLMTGVISIHGLGQSELPAGRSESDIYEILLDSVISYGLFRELDVPGAVRSAYARMQEAQNKMATLARVADLAEKAIAKAGTLG